MSELNETYQSECKSELVFMHETRAKYYSYMVGDDVVGEVQLHCGAGQVTEIWGFEIYPSYKRLGYGSRMYRALEKSLPTHTTIWLWVREDNVAGVQFWIEQGFSSQVRTNRGYRMCKIS